MNLSERLLEASTMGKEGIVYLLSQVNARTIDTLQNRVIKEYMSLENDAEKKIYADNIIKANNLPLCIEFNRIITNSYTREEYLKYTYFESGKHEKYSKLYSLFESFKEHSTQLNLKINSMKKIQDNINSQKMMSGRRRASRLGGVKI